MRLLLLSFEEPTRFIFSHSALREGWDNPNVFQICTLKQSNSEINKRQEVGRGMRLCVNSSGDRMDATSQGIKVHDVNVLTVIASDSYKDFVGGLQKELKETLYQRPTKATKEYFEGKLIKVDGEVHEITKLEATIIERYLGFNQYIDYDGKVTDEYRNAQAKGTYAPFPREIAQMAESVHKLVQGVFDEKILDEMIVSANKPKITENNLNENFAKKEFQALWNYIHNKYAYTVSFDSNELIEKSIKAMNEQMYVFNFIYSLSNNDFTNTPL